MSLLESDPFNPGMSFRTQDRCVVGERRLMAAILEDALDCYRKYMLTPSASQRKVFRDAERWLLAEDDWLFSFRNVCAVLELSPEAIRSEMRVWRRSHFAAMTATVSAVGAA